MIVILKCYVSPVLKTTRAPPLECRTVAAILVKSGLILCIRSYTDMYRAGYSVFFFLQVALSNETKTS